MLLKRLNAAIDKYYNTIGRSGCGSNWAETTIEPVNEELMLSSYALMKCIHTYLQCHKIAIRSIPTLYMALQDVILVIESTNQGSKSLYYEAEKLEDLSRAVYRYLKTKGLLCKELLWTLDRVI